MISLKNKSENYCYNQLGYLQSSYYQTDRKVTFGVYVSDKIEDLNLPKHLLESKDVLNVLFSIYDMIEEGIFNN